MIELTDLHYRYSSGGDALSSINLSVGEGSLVGVVGANGSGKSTLMALIAGLYTPTSGAVVVDGLANPGNGRAIRKACRMVMQDADLQILGATVEEDLLIGRSRTDETLAEARNIAGRLRLDDAWDRPVHTLSWGMKRKLCLAAALLDDPRVLLLDEPFSGLDYPGICEMRALIAENGRNGLTQVVSSHDLECFADMVDSLAVLDGGRLVLSGPPDSILGKVLEHGVRPPCSWMAGKGVQAYEGSR